MIEIKRICEREVLSIKENHVLGCFTDYLYHKYASNQIQEELEWISSELSTGAPSAGIIKVSKDSNGNVSPWQNELIARESELIQEQDKHEEAIELVDGWLINIKNENHKDIIVDYLINNRCENADAVAENCYTTKGNVCKVAQRYVTNIARRIS